MRLLSMHKLTTFFLLAAFIGSACSRAPTYGPDVMEQSYQHKYGVEVSANDWQQRGGHGQVIITLKSGVKVSKTYVAGELDGDSTYTFPHRETIQKRETYAKGRLLTEQLYYPSGAPKERSVFKDGTEEKVIWMENGLPQVAELYQEGLLVQGEYYNALNKVESLVRDKEGTRIRRDQYGQLASTDLIKDGKMVSRTFYHPNGNPKQIITFKNDEIDGELKLFHPEGEPDMIQEWKEGKHTGMTTMFENGEKLAEIPYVDGKKNGIEKHFKNGKVLVEEIAWEDDQRHGLSTIYIGSKSSPEWYFHGKPVSKMTFDRMSPKR